MRELAQVLIPAFAGLVASLPQTASAHFPWIVLDEQQHAVYFFGESLAERTYNLPTSITEAKLFLRDGEHMTRVPVMAVDTEKWVGLRSKAAIPAGAEVVAHTTFGIYQGARLEYYTQQFGKLANDFLDREPMDVALQVRVVAQNSGVGVQVLWKGEPLKDAEVKLFNASGTQDAEATTNSEGKVAFSDTQVEGGLKGIMVGYVAPDEAGKLGDTEYASSAHYLTATFRVQSGEHGPARSKSAQKLQSSSTADPSTQPQSMFAKLPIGITSFGAARLGESIFVYGGHTGSAHSYWDESQSNQLLKLDLAHPNRPWHVAAEGERLQGLAMLAHDSQLVLIGGFQARNPKGEEHDLHSVRSVKAYDVGSQAWTDLPDLPLGRSSHDAALIGDKLYVVGGWLLNGQEETQWHQTALVLDLSQDAPEWQEIASPSFKRRALAVAAHAGQLFVVGGMNEEGGPTRAVEIYDPASDSWSSGPELNGTSGMDGFGASAWSVNGHLAVTDMRGTIQVLSHDGKNWKTIGSTEDARFFHRMLPLAEKSLLSVGGANMESGKFLEPEVIQLP